MPYIAQEDRKELDGAINTLVSQLHDKPIVFVNYVISRIIWGLFFKKRSYTTGNNLIGALRCVEAEFYRRHLAPYEDEKIIENGDVTIF